MRILVTGATGFLGRHVVAEADRRGHAVTSVIRPSSAVETALDGGPHRIARVDLRSRAGLTEALTDVDVVVHLAAAKAGDFQTQFAGTVVATENLLAAMVEAEVHHLVAMSTFSVYDYSEIPAGTLLDEDAPVEADPARRDEYARTKLIQEELYRAFAADEAHRTVILRPGMIYGPGELWHALLGAEMGPRYLRIGAKATLPLTYVENCADAVVLAAERLRDAASGVDGEVLNIVDDRLPTQRAYAELVAARMDTPPTVDVPWPVVRAAAGALQRANDLLVGGRAKFPGIAVPDRLDARFKPLRYSNAKARELLGWSPRVSLVDAIDRSVAAQQRDATGSG